MYQHQNTFISIYFQPIGIVITMKQFYNIFSKYNFILLVLLNVIIDIESSTKFTVLCSTF